MKHRSVGSGGGRAFSAVECGWSTAATNACARDGDADLSLEVAVGKLSFDMIRHLDKAEKVLSAMYVDA